MPQDRLARLPYRGLVRLRLPPPPTSLVCTVLTNFHPSTYGLQSADKAALGISAVFGLLSDLQLYLEVDGVVDSGRYSLVSR